MALAFVLLIGGGLLLASFRQLLGVDPGFRPEHVLTGRVSPLETRYPDDAALSILRGSRARGHRALPGVEAAGVTSFLPFSWDGNSSVIVAEGYVMAPGESLVSPNQLYVTAGYLETLRVPLKRGRFFTRQRHRTAPKVIIVDEQLAKKFWPNARSHWSPHVPARQAGRRREAGPDTHLAAGRRRRGHGEAQGPDRRREARAGATTFRTRSSLSRGIGFAIRTTATPPP